VTVLNHFRTLLVNAPGAAASGPYPRAEADSAPGDEAVPAGFAPVRLPPALAAVRAAVFGDAPDRAMLAYRAREVLAAVHAAGMGGFALALDPRLSYDPACRDAPLADPALFEPRAAAGLHFLGEPAAPDAAGRCAYAFRVDAGLGELAVTPLSSAGEARTYAVTYAGGLSSPVPLGLTGLSARAEVYGGPSWLVAGLLRPRLGLAGVVARAAALGPPLEALFGRRAEPYATFRALWEEHPELAPRAAALACALVYRTEEARGR
jgi:hypothetical protein